MCRYLKGSFVRQSEPQRRTGPRELAADSPPVFRTKAQLVYEQLRDWIVRGKLRPGESVDQERLADMLDVSRMPLRQALLRLESDRLIERQPHHTAVVTHLSVSDIDDIYGARSVLEGLLAEKGAAVRDDDLIAQLTATSAEMAKAIESADNEGFVVLDRLFHMSLYKASGYPRTIEIFEQLRSAAERYMYYYVSGTTAAPQSLSEHDAILAAYREGKPRLVRKLTEKHLMRSAAELRKLAGSASVSPRPAPGAMSPHASRGSGG
jgi:DNA-binding GntR family transcriptional regulator